MANPNTELLGALRLTKVLQVMQDIREMPQTLKFLSRVKVVPALREEIIARFLARVMIADIVADDAAARIYQFGRFSTETVNIPNIKIGIGLNQAEINQLTALAGLGGPATSDPDSLYSRFYNKIGEALLLGIRQRWEQLLVAAAIDSYNYDSFGIKLSGVNFGTWADLKMAASPTWDVPATATPVTDILTLKRLALTRYGKRYNRLTTSLSAFMFMIATTEFINRVRVMYGLNPTITAATIPLQNTKQLLTMAAPILDLDEIEFYDDRFWYQDAAGNATSARYLPANMAVLSDSADDNQPGAWDLANTTTTESQVAGIVPTGMIGALPAGSYGPHAYAAPTTPDLNPPGIVAWGVAASWPRKWDPAVTASITAGTFGDTIPVGVPYPVPSFQ